MIERIEHNKHQDLMYEDISKLTPEALEDVKRLHAQLRAPDTLSRFQLAYRLAQLPLADANSILVSAEDPTSRDNIAVISIIDDGVAVSANEIKEDVATDSNNKKRKASEGVEVDEDAGVDALGNTMKRTKHTSRASKKAKKEETERKKTTKAREVETDDEEDNNVTTRHKRSVPHRGDWKCVCGFYNSKYHGICSGVIVSGKDRSYCEATKSRNTTAVVTDPYAPEAKGGPPGHWLCDNERCWEWVPPDERFCLECGCQRVSANFVMPGEPKGVLYSPSKTKGVWFGID